SELETGLARLTRTIGDAVAGEQEAIDAFERGGVEFLNYAGGARTTEDVLRQVMDRIRATTAEADRARLAVDYFGKSGQKLLPILSGGADALSEFERAARAAGVVLDAVAIAKADEAADAWARFDFRMQKLGQTIAVHLLDPMSRFVDLLERAAQFDPFAIAGLSSISAGPGAATMVLGGLFADDEDPLQPSRGGMGAPHRPVDIGPTLPQGDGGSNSAADRIQKVIDGLNHQIAQLDRT